jgi:hypothetical protein
LRCHPVAVHIYTQTIYRTTQITTNVEECGPCPVFASFTLTYALQLRKKYGKTSVRVRETSIRVLKTSVRETPCLLKSASANVSFYTKNSKNAKFLVVPLLLQMSDMAVAVCRCARHRLQSDSGLHWGNNGRRAACCYG